MTGSVSSERSEPAGRPVVVTTDDVPPEHRFEFWQQFCGEVNAVSVPEASVPGFSARCESWTLGSMILTSNATPEMSLSRSARQTARDGLDHIILRVCRTGATETRNGEREYAARARQVVLESFSEGYDDRWSASEWVSLNIAPADDPELCAALAATGTGTKQGAAATLLGDFLLALAARLPDLGESELPVAAGITRSMVAHCLIGASARIGDPPTALEAQQRIHVIRVVRENLSSARLDVHRLCQLTGLSRSTMYRMFERDGGVAAYIRRLRLAEAHAILSDRGRARQPISSVAESCGYHCVASFNRAFRAEFACTPGDVRAAAAEVREHRPPPRPLAHGRVSLRDIFD